PLRRGVRTPDGGAVRRLSSPAGRHPAESGQVSQERTFERPLLTQVSALGGGISPQFAGSGRPGPRRHVDPCQTRISGTRSRQRLPSLSSDVRWRPMSQTLHTPTAPPTPSPARPRDRHVSDFKALMAQVRESGHMRRRYGYYWSKLIGLTAAGVGLAVGFVHLGDTWWQIVTAVALALLLTQIAF